MFRNYQYYYQGLTAPEIEAHLHSSIIASLQEKYGSDPDVLIKQRLDEEWAAIKRTHSVEKVAFAHEFAGWLRKENHPYVMGDGCGGSFILYLLDVTSGNSLPPHVHCPECHYFQWKPECADGFDIPETERICNDGTTMIGDGHNLVWQTAWGMDENYTPLLWIQIPMAVLKCLPFFMEQHWIQQLNPMEGKLFQYYDAIFVRHHIEFSSYMSEDDKTYKSTNTNCIEKAMAVWERECSRRMECGDDRDMHIPTPQRFSEVIYNLGLLNSDGVWDEDAELRVRSNSTAQMIVFREDLFYYLVKHGYSECDAWNAMYDPELPIFRGLPIVTEEMKEAEDAWVLDRCERLAYLCSKAHTIEDLIHEIRLMD